MNKTRIIIEEVQKDRWYYGILGNREQAEIAFNHLVNWGVVDGITELNEQGGNFFYVTVRPTRLFAYYVMRYAQKYSRLHRKGQAGGIAPLAKKLAAQKIARIPREKITPFIIASNHDLVASAGFKLGFLSHKSEGMEE